MRQAKSSALTMLEFRGQQELSLTPHGRETRFSPFLSEVDKSYLDGMRDVAE